MKNNSFGFNSMNNDLLFKNKQKKKKFYKSLSNNTKLIENNLLINNKNQSGLNLFKNNSIQLGNNLNKNYNQNRSHENYSQNSETNDSFSISDVNEDALILKEEKEFDIPSDFTVTEEVKIFNQKVFEKYNELLNYDFILKGGNRAKRYDSKNTQPMILEENPIFNRTDLHLKLVHAVVFE